jgi:hypothetical protein
MAGLTHCRGSLPRHVMSGVAGRAIRGANLRSGRSGPDCPGISNEDNVRIYKSLGKLTPIKADTASPRAGAVDGGGRPGAGHALVCVSPRAARIAVRPGGEGRLAQRESASFTPRRSLVRSQYRPPGQRPVARRDRPFVIFVQQQVSGQTQQRCSSGGLAASLPCRPRKVYPGLRSSQPRRSEGRVTGAYSSGRCRET